MSSFFFGGRTPSGRAAELGGGGGGRGAPPPGSDDSELRRALLEDATVDLETCYDDRFVFSWRRLLLHVGCVAGWASAPTTAAWRPHPGAFSGTHALLLLPSPGLAP